MAQMDFRRELIPIEIAYSHYLFAFTPSCTQFCEDDQFGAKSLSSEAGFLPEYRKHCACTSSNLSTCIIGAVETMLHNRELGKCLGLLRDALKIQGPVLHAMLPMAMFDIICPPCISAITTAAHICQAKSDGVMQLRVRVDHRLGCACCDSTESGVARLQMIVDTIADIEAGHHWAKPTDSESWWMPYIDRKWLQQVLYDQEYGEPAWATQGGHHDYIGVRNMLTLDMTFRRVAARVAVVLADVASASWIMEAAPFPVIDRPPLPGEMYHVYKDHVRISSNIEAVRASKSFERSFVGTFATTGSAKRRRDESLPPSPKAKKRRTASW